MIKLYIADLAEYSSGRLVGKWFELDDYNCYEDLENDITEMLSENGNEEWAIHDYEADFPISEYEDLETLFDIMELMEEYSEEHVSACIDYFGKDNLQTEIEDTYFYEDMTLEEYAIQDANEKFEQDNVSYFYQDHFDYESYAVTLGTQGYNEVCGGVLITE